MGVNQRASIALSEREITHFLSTTRTVVLGTIGRSGLPHLVAMWFALDDDELVMWSYTKSQKVRNIQRDPRVTCLVEDGDTYGELRGVEIEGVAALSAARTDVKLAWDLLNVKYARGATSSEALATFERQAAKRSVIRVKPSKIVSWDHRKLKTGTQSDLRSTATS